MATCFWTDLIKTSQVCSPDPFATDVYVNYNSLNNNKTLAYSVSGNSWLTMAAHPSPTRIGGLEGVVLRQGESLAGYLCAGNTSGGPVNDLDQYIPDTWTSKTSAPAARRDMSGSDLNEKAYFTGGGTATSNWTLTNQEYTPDVWVIKTNLTFAHWSASAFTLGSSLFIVNGIPNPRKTESYAPDTWTVRTDYPGANNLGAHASGAISDAGYVIGNSQAGFEKDNKQYVVDTWTNKTISPVKRVRTDVAVVSSRIYIAGSAAIEAKQRIDEYINDSWANKADAPLTINDPADFGL